MTVSTKIILNKIKKLVVNNLKKNRYYCDKTIILIFLIPEATDCVLSARNYLSTKKTSVVLYIYIIYT